ncbi:MAG: MutS family DNA mismatch repair protein [Rhodothermales bacterium]
MALSHTNQKSKHFDLLERYARRLDRRIQRLQVLSLRYSRVRLCVVLFVSVVCIFLFRQGSFGAGWGVMVVGIVCFGALVFFHDKILNSTKRHRYWKAIKQAHLSRMQRDWANLPAPLHLMPDPSHPFELDLNLTGYRSMHQLMNTAPSRGGGERLAHWLLEPFPDPGRIAERQILVKELAETTLFRDHVSLASKLVSANDEEPWDGETLLKWVGDRDTPFKLLRVLNVLFGLAIVNIVLVALHVVGLLPAWWIASLILYGAIYSLSHRNIGSASHEAFKIEKGLKRFRSVWAYLEVHHYHKMPRTAILCKPFLDSTAKPSNDLSRIERIAAFVSLQMALGGLMAPALNILMPWDLFFTYRLHLAKQSIRHKLPVWLNVWHELEALSSMATFADLHSDYVYPDILNTPSEAFPTLTARHVGHPLLDEASKVKNDFTIDTLGRVIIITGSNMSGKSTFLRTLGVNLQLAYMGAPVDAASFSVAPMRVYTCLQVHDSINDGISFFYAEVKRLKALYDAFRDPHPYPLFFLVDEIFRGTNNRERLIGSRAFIRSLAGGHGVGLIATHDLELVHLEDEIPHIQNYNFREEIEDGKMVFDYRLHSGPCPTTNALRIMELEGLPVKGIDWD